VSTAGATLQQSIGELLASRPEAMRDPFAVWRRLREEEPVHVRPEIVLLSRYDDVKALIRDELRFSSNAFAIGSRAETVRAGLSGEQLAAFEDLTAFESMYVSRSDPPAHDRLRRIAHRAFTPRRIAELEASVQSYTDRMLGGGALDFMDFAFRLPLMVIADLLGVPQKDRELIHGWSGKLGRNRGGTDVPALMEAHAALVEFREYVRAMVAERARRPGQSDLVTALVGATDEENLSNDELTAMFVVLLFAGHETTTNLLGTGLQQLLRHRDQWDVLTGDPSLVPGAVEELLRWVTPVQWLNRVALEDMEWHGVPIAAGTSVTGILAAANRDPRVFEDPERLDVTRSDAKRHIALGFGPHFCLGASLARLEGTVAFTTLARRFPQVELTADPDEWRGNAMLRSLASLPVDLGPERGSSSRSE
jgi:cytochrome P450